MLHLIILFSGISNLIMGFLVGFGSDDKKGKKSFVFFSISTFIWAVFVFLIYEYNFPITVRLSYSGGALMITSLLLWVYNFTSTSEVRKSSFLKIILPGLFFLFVPFIDGLLICNIRENSIGGFDADDGVLFPLYAFYILFVYIFVIFRLVKLLRVTSENKKRQVKAILKGVSLFIGLSILFVFVLPLFGYDKFIDFDVPFSMFFVVFAAYAMVKYRLMNIKIITVQVLALVVLAMSFVDIFSTQNVQMTFYKIFIFITLAILFYFLVKSVIIEINRKEELQKMTDSLAKANEELRKLDNAKTEFISIASHQLRTPLTAVKGFISLILEGSYGEISKGVRDALEKAYSSSERLIDLVEDLLNVSRIESGRMQFIFAKTDLIKIIKDLQVNFAMIAKGKGLSLDFKLPKAKIPKLYLDASKIREVVSNLIDNALKYTKEGGVTVTVEKTSSKTVRIVVADTGIGIPPQEAPHLFKKFSRGKDIERLHANGTGLGLYVGKSIIDRHCGKIWFESAGAGKGTKFIIELPIKRSIKEK